MEFLEPLFSRAVLSSQFWIDAFNANPARGVAELALIFFLSFLFFKRPYDPKKAQGRSKKDEAEILRNWQPKSLVPENWQKPEEKKALILESATGAEVTCNGRKCVSFASMDFQNFANDTKMKELCRETIDKYGVGSCGPRGFYGTIDVHLTLEEEITKFFGTEETILYSDGIACIASVLACYAKRGDLIVSDEGAHYGIQQGICLSRCNALYFKHNDLQDLEKVLAEVKEQDKKNPPAKLPRRFIVVEGIYQNHGDICNLAEVARLAKKYKYRLVVDDSLTLGVLGATGRGSTEHWNVPVTDVDLLCASLDALGTIGAFCTGTHILIDYQRLNGLGYCFSASAPPFTCTAGIHGFRSINSERSERLRNNAQKLRRLLTAIPGAVVIGEKEDRNSISPVIHIRLDRSIVVRGEEDEKTDHKRTSKSKAAGSFSEETFFHEIRNELLSHGVITYVPDYIPAERDTPPHSILIYVTMAHTEEHMELLAKLLREAWEKNRSKLKI